MDQAATAPSTKADDSIGLFGARSRAKELAAEVHLLRAMLEKVGGLSLLEIEQQKVELTQQLTDQKASLAQEIGAETGQPPSGPANAAVNQEVVAQRLHVLRAQTVITEDTLILQEVGVYQYTHPLDDSVAYKAELAKLQDQVKAMARKMAELVTGSEQMTMNGSRPQGAKMVREFSKLLLRAYNNEADNLVRGMRPYKLQSSKDRLEKAKNTIEKLGQSMDIHIGPWYHGLRLREMELTADFLEKVAREKELEKEEKVRLREERQAQVEFQRQREKLERERAHYVNASAALEAKGDAAGILNGCGPRWGRSTRRFKMSTTAPRTSVRAMST